jgi:hypothetical protein
MLRAFGQKVQISPTEVGGYFQILSTMSYMSEGLKSHQRQLLGFSNLTANRFK